MELQISKRYSSYDSQSNGFKPVLNFHPNGAHKMRWGILTF